MKKEIFCIILVLFLFSCASAIGESSWIKTDVSGKPAELLSNQKSNQKIGISKDAEYSVISGNTVLGWTGPNVCRNPADFHSGFENGIDAGTVSSGIPEINFGDNWVYSDVRTVDEYDDPIYNYPYFWVIGHNAIDSLTGEGRIDFTRYPARYFSAMVSAETGATIDAYAINGSFVATSGYSGKTTGTNSMARLTVEAPEIAFVIVHDGGGRWIMDEVCTDGNRPGLPEIEDIEISPDATTTKQVTFTAKVSDASDYEILNYQWTEIDVNTNKPDFSGNGNPLYTKPDAGTHGKKKIKCVIFYKNRITGVMGSSEPYEEEFNLFFIRDGFDTPKQKSEPNWYVYWKRDGAVPDLSTFKFDSKLPSNKFAYFQPPNTLFIGPSAVNGKRDIVSVDSSTHTLYTGYIPEGIIRVSDLCAHELQHLYFYQMSVGIWKNLKNSDKDILPDVWETGATGLIYSLEPNNPDTYDLAGNLRNHDYANYGDEELLCRLFAKQSQNYEYYPEKDWAKPGSQKTSPVITSISRFPGDIKQFSLNGEDYNSNSNEFSETTEDTDSNGLINQLIINMGLSVTESGNYTVVAILNDTYGEEVTFTIQDFDLDAGDSILPLRFDGFDINYHHVDGPFNLSYILYSDEEDNDIENKSDIYKTSPYRYSAFEGAEAQFINRFSETTTDRDYDGNYEELIINNKVNVTISGNFSLRGDLYDSGGKKICTSFNDTWLGVGEQQIGLAFNGKSIFDNQINGPFYLTSLTLGDSENNFYDYIEKPYTTSSYRYSDFKSTISFQNTFRDYGQDKNNVGLYDNLLISAEVTATKPGNYSFIGVLTDNYGSEIVQANNISTVPAGTSNILFIFDGEKIASHKMNGSYTVGYLAVLDTNLHIIDDATDAYKTSVYNYTQFYKPSEPVANFMINTTIGFAPLTVRFNDISTGYPKTWNWSFGDGGVSKIQNPLHTYTQVGTYTVSLNVTNAEGFDSVTRTNYITVTIPKPVPGFSANVTSGTVPLTVSFSDLSLNNPTGWAWYFGDETYTEPSTQVTESAGWPARAGQTSVVMADGSIVLMGGWDVNGNYLNDVWRSTDNGATWTQMTTSAGWLGREGHSSVAMPDSSIVLMGGWDDIRGYKNDVWRSTDSGATWTQMTANAGWSARYTPSSVAMPDGSIVLMGGESSYRYKNDVWRSTDNGATWTLVNASAGWTARFDHSSVAMPDGSIVLMGGYQSAHPHYMNDVWRSTDSGATWTQMNESAGWTARCDHSSVAMPDGSIVLMGGGDGGDFKNDVWRSTNNGAMWAQMTASAGWTARAYHTSVAMPDGSIVLMGGYDRSRDEKNDVWRLQPVGSSAQNPLHTYTTPGTYQVTLQAYNIGGYNITSKTGYITVGVGVLPIPGYTTPPTDPDNDGIYEDLNGNGRLDFADVVLYFNQMEWIVANEPVTAFDLNSNGRIDFADIVKLFGEI